MLQNRPGLQLNFEDTFISSNALFSSQIKNSPKIGSGTGWNNKKIWKITKICSWSRFLNFLLAYIRIYICSKDQINLMFEYFILSGEIWKNYGMKTYYEQRLFTQYQILSKKAISSDPYKVSNLTWYKSFIEIIAN